MEVNSLLTGLVIGSFLDIKTLLILSGLWMITTNYQLPEFLGGQPIQDVFKKLVVKLN